MRKPRLSCMLVLSPLAAAVSLSDFQPITSTNPTCLRAYKAQIPVCQTSDFANGAHCSEACMQALVTVQDEVQGVCKGIKGPSDTLMGQVLAGKMVVAVCPNYKPSPAPAPRPTTTTTTSRSSTSTTRRTSTSTTSTTSSSTSKTSTTKSKSTSSSLTSTSTPSTVPPTVVSTSSPTSLDLTPSSTPGTFHSPPSNNAAGDAQQNDGTPFDIASSGSGSGVSSGAHGTRAGSGAGQGATALAAGLCVLLMGVVFA